MYIDVKHNVVTLLQEALAERGYNKIKVLKGDPRTPADIPCVGVNRAGDDEVPQSLGEDFGSEYDPATDKWTETRGTHFSETLEIRIWHSNADERDKLYALCKVLLFSIRPILTAQGVLNIVLRGGRDEQDNTFPPHPLYWGTITMNYAVPLEVDTLWDTVRKVDVMGYLTAEFQTEIRGEEGEVDGEKGT